MWDIAGKTVGKPIYELLGGRVRERLRPTATSTPAPATRPTPTSTPTLGAERAGEYAALGFSAIKFDPAGAYASFDPRQPSLADLERCERYVAQVREAVGPHVDLLIGTHGQFTPAGAIRLARRLEPSTRCGSRSQRRRRRRRRWRVSRARRRSLSRPASA